jgi:hypothetical protein
MGLFFHIVAVVLFVLAALGIADSEVASADLIAWGLASFAFGFVIDPLLAWGRRR